MAVNDNYHAIVVAAATLDRAGAPQRHAAAMSQFAIERRDHPRTALPTVEARTGNPQPVGVPNVGKIVRVPPVPFSSAHHRRTSVTVPREHPSHNTPRRTLDGQPAPYFVCSLAENVRISSNSRVSRRLRCAFFRRNQGSRGTGRSAFFYFAIVARYARQAHDTIQLTVFQQHLVDLHTLSCALDGSRLEIARKLPLR